MDENHFNEPIRRQIGEFDATQSNLMALEVPGYGSFPRVPINLE